jgi:hypothetical protein
MVAYLKSQYARHIVFALCTLLGLMNIIAMALPAVSDKLLCIFDYWLVLE